MEGAVTKCGVWGVGCGDTNAGAPGLVWVTGGVLRLDIDY